MFTDRGVTCLLTEIPLPLWTVSRISRSSGFGFFFSPVSISAFAMYTGTRHGEGRCWSPVCTCHCRDFCRFCGKPRSVEQSRRQEIGFSRCGFSWGGFRRGGLSRCGLKRWHRRSRNSEYVRLKLTQNQAAYRRLLPNLTYRRLCTMSHLGEALLILSLGNVVITSDELN